MNHNFYDIRHIYNISSDSDNLPISDIPIISFLTLVIRLTLLLIPIVYFFYKTVKLLVSTVVLLLLSLKSKPKRKYVELKAKITRDNITFLNRKLERLRDYLDKANDKMKELQINNQQHLYREMESILFSIDLELQTFSSGLRYTKRNFDVPVTNEREVDQMCSLLQMEREVRGNEGETKFLINKNI